MAGTPKVTGPTALTTTLTTNIYNQTSALIYDVIRHIHISNVTSAAATFSLWLGATGANAAGTELFKGRNVAANAEYDWYGTLKVTSTQFLVGGANLATSLTILIEHEQYVV